MNMTIDHNTTKSATEFQVKLYKRRWLNMILFVSFAIIAGTQWVQFTIIKDIIVKYYNVSPLAVEWTSFVYMLSYLLFVSPSIILLNKLGIRCMMIIASAGVCTGAWIKMFSTDSDKFFLVLIGQTFEGVSSVLTIGMAARFTAIWFGANEISLAGAIALIGDQCGSALAFLFPILMVENSEDKNVVANGLRFMHTTIATISTIILILMILLFRAKPTHPPSIAESLKTKIKTENMKKSSLKTLSNPAFILFTVAYSLCMAASNALWTMLNEIVLINFPDHNKDAGNIGFIVMVMGMISSLLLGFYLDKTKKYKQSVIQLTVGAFISVILFTVTLKLHNIIYVYVTAVMVGIFMQSFYIAGLQIGVETAYPISEATAAAVMLFFVQLISLIVALAYAVSLKEYGDIKSNIGICLIILISSVCCMLMPANFKRNNVEHGIMIKELEEFLP